MAKITVAYNVRAYDTYEVDLDSLPQEILRALEDIEDGYEEEASEVVTRYLEGLPEAPSHETGDVADDPQYNAYIEEN